MHPPPTSKWTSKKPTQIRVKFPLFFLIKKLKVTSKRWVKLLERTRNSFKLLQRYINELTNLFCKTLTCLHLLPFSCYMFLFDKISEGGSGFLVSGWPLLNLCGLVFTYSLYYPKYYPKYYFCQSYLIKWFTLQQLSLWKFLHKVTIYNKTQNLCIINRSQT